MKIFGIAIVAFLLMTTLWIGGVIALAQVESNDAKVAVLDECDPTDLTFAAIGGCGLPPRRGDVTRGEAIMLLISPLSLAVIGHPSLRNEPSYLSIRPGRTVRITNRGGLSHTFTEVTNFGGGFLPNPAVNYGLTQAPQCTPTGTTALAPGDTMELNGLAPGLHRFQCCIHPWMRAAIRVN